MAGSEDVRVTVNNEEAAAAVPAIVEGLEKRQESGCRSWASFSLQRTPVAEEISGTKALAKYRINPGNASIGKKDNDNFQVMVECAVEDQNGAHRA